MSEKGKGKSKRIKCGKFHLGGRMADHFPQQKYHSFWLGGGFFSGWILVQTVTLTKKLPGEAI